MKLPVRHLGVGQGLPQGSVYSLYQDRKGFVWVGTGDGLARWDGRQFLSYRGRHGDTSGKKLAARMIRGRMVEDGADGLWMNTSLGIVRFDLRSERFTIINEGNRHDVEHCQLLGISQGRLYYYTEQHLYRVDTRTQRTIRLPLDLNGINSIVLDGDQLYAVTSEGLHQIDAVGSSMKLILPNKSIQQVFALEGGGLQIWAVQELIIRTPKMSKRYTLDALLDGAHWMRMPMTEGSAYGVDTGGLFLLDAAEQRIEHIGTNKDPKHSLSNVLVNVVMLDRSGNLWCGTEGSGLDIVDTKGFKFQVFPYEDAAYQSEDLMVKSITGVGNKIWIGTFDKGLFELDPLQRTARNWRDRRATLDRISLLFRDSKGRVWMNREEEIGIVDTVNKTFLLSAKMPSSISSNLTAYSMLELGPDDFLIGTTYRLYRMQVNGQGLEIRPVAPEHVATTGIIAALARWPDGSVFIGKVRDGFYRIRIQQDGIQVLDKGLHYTGIRDFLKGDRGQTLWMATENGLARYVPNSKELQLIDEADGLSNSHIYGIIPEGDSVLWLSSNKGLNRITLRYKGNQLLTPEVRSYTEAEGLQSNEFNTGAFCQLPDGAIAFGGVKGINWFYPSRFRSNPYAPEVSITSIAVNEKPWTSDTAYSYLKTLSLPYTGNTLAFQMAALEYTNSGSNRYRYKLEGFDKDWVDGGTSGEARYANLSPGHYTFQVMAANSDGVWSSNPAQLYIHINPPWWQTLAARSGALLLIVSLILLGIRRYVRNKVRASLREIEKQQAVNEERLRISRDMHDELGTGLTKIALLSEVARRKAHAVAPQSLYEISTTSRQLTQKIGEIVWTLNPQNDTLDTLASYIREWVQDQYDSLEDVFVRTEFEEQFPELALSHSVRQALLLVTKEAVNNAVKYAQATEIVVRIWLSKEAIQFEVADNGRGFVPGERTRALGGNGLKNMAARMAAVGGELQILSQAQSGTSIRYSIALGSNQ